MKKTQIDLNKCIINTTRTTAAALQNNNDALGNGLLGVGMIE